jgi:hypothetical protein
MKYVFYAFLVLAGIAFWLTSTDDGKRMKQRLLDQRDRSVSVYQPE